MTKLIAITGGSGAGKTTIARALSRRLGAAVIAEDDYYRCSTSIPNFDASTHNFDAPETKEHDLLEAHLRRARNGLSFDKPLYDLSTHRRRSETERVDPGTALIVEGIHLLVSERLRALFDIAVFVDADEALRLGRRMIRDVEARNRTPRSVFVQFFTNVRAMHDAHVQPQLAHADLVLHSPADAGPAHAEADAVRILERLEKL
jgi:uridine kinase